MPQQGSHVPCATGMCHRTGFPASSCTCNYQAFGVCDTAFALLWGNLEVLAAPWVVKAGSPILELLGKDTQDGGKCTNPRHAIPSTPSPKHRCHTIRAFCQPNIPIGAPSKPKHCCTGWWPRGSSFHLSCAIDPQLQVLWEHLQLSRWVLPGAFQGNFLEQSISHPSFSGMGSAFQIVSMSKLGKSWLCVPTGETAGATGLSELVGGQTRVPIPSHKLDRAKQTPVMHSSTCHWE